MFNVFLLIVELLPYPHSFTYLNQTCLLAGLSIDNEQTLKANAHHTEKPTEQLQTETLALGIALKNFDNKYGKLLTTEQKDCLVKYYTTKDERNFSTWMKKRIDNILDEVAVKKDKVDNEKIKEKNKPIIETKSNFGFHEMIEEINKSLRDISKKQKSESPVFAI